MAGISEFHKIMQSFSRHIVICNEAEHPARLTSGGA